MIGTVDSLWRYPVKSLLGEKIDTVTLDARGLVGDRIYAVSNSDGKFGSGKNTRRFRRIDGLFSLSARTVEHGVLIRLPNGKELTDREDCLNDELSDTLGQSVTLTKEGEISHFDDGAIHILTTASLSSLEALLPDSRAAASRFRPNIVINTMHAAETLVGKFIRVGGTVLQVSHETERCRMVTLVQPDLENRPEILKAISKYYDLNFGVYARIVSKGDISVGDRVQHVRE